MACNDALTPFVLLANKIDDWHMVQDGLQSTPIEN